MNKLLRESYESCPIIRSDCFLEYCRSMEVFEGISGQKNASPHWYGTVADPSKLVAILTDLRKNNSIKRNRLESLAEEYSEGMSPVIRFVGLMIKIFLEKEKKILTVEEK